MATNAISSQWIGKIAIVTGASAGIGYALLASLADIGIITIGCARNIASIESLSNSYTPRHPSGKIIAIKCDVTQEADIIQMINSGKTRFGGVDILINNAGFSHISSVTSGKTSDWQDMLNVNVLGLSICTREFVKQLKERNVISGYIINISSILGHVVSQTDDFHFLTATKFAVTALTESVRLEMRAEPGNQVKVSQISPGLVATEFVERMYKDEESAKKLYAENPHLQAIDVCNAVLYLLSTPPGVGIHDIIMTPF